MEAAEIDFLFPPRTRTWWMPAPLAHPLAWQVLSGDWKRRSPRSVVYRQDPAGRHGENIALAGSRRWRDFDLRVGFRFLTESSRPPEGGAIIYFFWRDPRNFYSYHFCLAKQRVEFIKRQRGVWSILGETAIPLAPQNDISVKVVSRGHEHACCVNGVGVPAVKDGVFSRGRLGIGVKFCDLELNAFTLSRAAEA